MAKGSRKPSFFVKYGRLSLTVLAVFITLLPIISAGIWVKNTFFADDRHVIELNQLQKPQDAPKLFNEPLISVTFDDGWETVYRSGAPVLDKHSIRTTQYILSGSFDNYDYLSKEQVLSLHKAGHDIQSHTITHRDLTSLPTSELVRELSDSKNAISSLIGKPVRDFATPLNRHNTSVIDEVKKQYRSHRNTEADIDTLYDGSFNTRDNFDPYQISAFSVRRTTSLEKLQKFIEIAKEKNAWIVLIYHQIDDKSDDYYAVSAKNLDDQMALIKSQNIRIATIEEVMDVYEKNK